MTTHQSALLHPLVGRFFNGLHFIFVFVFTSGTLVPLQSLPWSCLNLWASYLILWLHWMCTFSHSKQGFLIPFPSIWRASELCVLGSELSCIKFHLDKMMLRLIMAFHLRWPTLTRSWDCFCSFQISLQRKKGHCTHGTLSELFPSVNRRLFICFQGSHKDTKYLYPTFNFALVDKNYGRGFQRNGGLGHSSWPWITAYAWSFPTPNQGQNVQQSSGNFCGHLCTCTELLYMSAQMTAQKSA